MNSEILILLSKDEVEKAIQLLLSFSEGKEECFEIILQSARLNRIKKDFFNDIINYDDYTQKRNKIIVRLFEIYNILQENRVQIHEEKILSNKIEKKVEVIKPTKEKTRLISIKSFRNTVSIAASILFLFCYGSYQYSTLYYSNQSIAKAFLDYPISLYSSTRDDSRTNTSHFRGIHACSKGEFDKAITYFLEVDEATENYSETRFLLGIAYLQTNQANEAIHIFEEFLQDDRTSIFTYNVQWNLILAYLQKGDLEAVKKELKILLEQQNHINYKKGLELNNKLQSNWRVFYSIQH